MKIIDFHGHCGVQHNTEYKIAEICSYLHSSCVEKMVISSLSSLLAPEFGEADLKILSKKNIFVLTYWVNPYIKNWNDSLNKISESINIKGLKLHPTANIYEPTYEFLKPVFEYCRQNKLFITLHTDTFRSLPIKVVELIVDYPDVDVVLIHMDDPINSILLAKKFENVFLETSWIERKWNTLAPIKIALDSVDNNKIFFGTDFPYSFNISNDKNFEGKVRNYFDIIDYYQQLLPSEISEKILYFNAKKFLERYGVDFEKR